MVWRVTATFIPEKHSQITDDQPVKHIIVCTSSTRPANPPTGQHIFETDTNKTLKNTGTSAVPVWTDVGGGSKDISFFIPGDAFVKTGMISFVNGVARTVSKVRLSAGSAPTGADYIIDANKNGTTIFTTQTNRPKITAGTTSGVSVAPDVVALTEGDVLNIDIDQVGSTLPGTDIAITIQCT